MYERKKVTPNNQEFVIMSVDGYKKLAGIDPTSGKNLHWTTDSNVEIPIKMKLQKINGNEPLMPRTIPQLLLENRDNYTDWPSMHAETKVGKWTFWTWGEVWDISFQFAKALISFGVSKRSAVNIIGFNSPEWFFAFHGTIMADCISVGVYTTNTPSACQYVAEHSSAELVVVEDEIQMQKYLEILDQLPKLKGIVVWGVDRFEQKPHSIVMTWKEFLERGNSETGTNETLEDVVIDRIEKQVPGMCCDIVYTSGTTGNPKGVMLTHDNMFFVMAQVLRNWEDQGIEDGRERVVSYLPLSHSAAQIVDLINNLVSRCQVYFARPDALQGSLVETLTHAKPTIFLGVPRVWEKMEERLKELASQAPSFLQKISGWAKTKGTLSSEAKLHGGQNPYGYTLAHMLILGRIKKALGLDQARVLVVSAAPMKASTFQYFKSLDLPIINVYGMSESAAPETTAKPGKFKEGTVGYALDETHIKIEKSNKTDGGHEDEGEVCFRGRNNFIGYLNNESNTRETLDKDGYIHSGDLGTKDSEGFIRITGRIKELIITAGGENVAPVLIEDSLKNICPIINNVMVIGDNKKYLSALITFKVDIDNSTGMNTPTKNLTITVKKFLEEDLGVKGVTTCEEAMNNEVINKYIQEKIDENNDSAISRAQYVRKFRIIPVDFSMEGGELTPTLKLKRRIVNEKYSNLITEMYPEDEMAAKL